MAKKLGLVMLVLAALFLLSLIPIHQNNKHQNKQAASGQNSKARI